MKTCPNCHAQLPEEASFCPVCGTAIESIPHLSNPYYQQPAQPTPPVYIPPEPAFDPYDRTKDFEEGDIAANKLVSMLPYLMDFVGIIIALLMAPASKYVNFHVRQSIKFTVLEVLVSLASLVLCWTFLVPIAGVFALVVLMVLKLVSFVQVCGGKAKEPVLVRSIRFLK